MQANELRFGIINPSVKLCLPRECCLVSRKHFSEVRQCCLESRRTACFQKLLLLASYVLNFQDVLFNEGRILDMVLKQTVDVFAHKCD